MDEKELDALRALKTNIGYRFLEKWIKEKMESYFNDFSKKQLSNDELRELKGKCKAMSEVIAHVDNSLNRNPSA